MTLFDLPLVYPAQAPPCACGAPLEPTEFHDDTPEGDQMCPDCCVTCNPERNP